MTFLKKTLNKILLFVFCLLLAGAALFYFYFVRVDAGCAERPADAVGACYSVDLMGFIPIARAEIAISGQDKRGFKNMTMKLTPVSFAEKLAKGGRFELASAFKADNGEPREFSISLYDKKGLRYVKTSYYDFENNMLHWKKSYPPESNRTDFLKEFTVSAPSLSPLSALFLIIQKPSEETRDKPLTIQVQDIPYIARRTEETKDGAVTVITYAVGKDSSHLEPWRRRMDMKLDLAFSCGAEKTNAPGCFPFRIDLPFNILTMRGARSSQPQESGR